MPWSPSPVEQRVELRVRCGLAEGVKRAAARDLPGRRQESGPRGARERAPDADAPHAEIGQLRNAGEVAADEDVHRLRRHRRDDRGNLADVADAWCIQAVRASIAV